MLIQTLQMTNPENINTLKGKNILVVEDTESNFQLIRVTLLPTGAVVDRAEFGEEALQKISEESQYDLIIMDIKLPGMNGYEVTRKIREVNNKVPIIANTAFAMIGEEEKALKAGCNAYISKPTDRNLLLDTINSLILNP